MKLNSFFITLNILKIKKKLIHFYLKQKKIPMMFAEVILVIISAQTVFTCNCTRPKLEDCYIYPTDEELDSQLAKFKSEVFFLDNLTHHQIEHIYPNMTLQIELYNDHAYAGTSIEGDHHSRIGCPSHIVKAVRFDRWPKYIEFKRCNCDECLSSRIGHPRPRCEYDYEYRHVLLRNLCESESETWKYRKAFEKVPIRCHCP